MKDRSLHGLFRPNQPGFALLEVMVGLLLVGTLLGALATATQRALDAAVELRGAAAALSAGPSSDTVWRAWDWGPRVALAEWGPGPVLRVTGGAMVACEAQVGVWSDGWLLGEFGVPSTEAVVLGPDIWAGHVGEEVVLRTRLESEGWGPPWRTVVPDAYGGNRTDLALECQEPAEAVSYDSARTVVHLLGRSTCSAEVSWSTEPVIQKVLGAVLVLSEYDSGLCHSSIGNRTQSWLGAHARRIDVYF